jgi:hypothetical protein
MNTMTIMIIAVVVVVIPILKGKIPILKAHPYDFHT